MIVVLLKLLTRRVLGEKRLGEILEAVDQAWWKRVEPIGSFLQAGGKIRHKMELFLTGSSSCPDIGRDIGPDHSDRSSNQRSKLWTSWKIYILIYSRRRGSWMHRRWWLWVCRDAAFLLIRFTSVQACWDLGHWQTLQSSSEYDSADLSYGDEMNLTRCWIVPMEQGRMFCDTSGFESACRFGAPQKWVILAMKAALECFGGLWSGRGIGHLDVSTPLIYGPHFLDHAPLARAHDRIEPGFSLSSFGISRLWEWYPTSDK